MLRQFISYLWDGPAQSTVHNDVATVKMAALYWMGVYDVFMAADDMALNPSSYSASQCNQTGEWKRHNHRPPLLVNKIAPDTEPTWNYDNSSCYVMFPVSLVDANIMSFRVTYHVEKAEQNGWKFVDHISNELPVIKYVYLDWTLTEMYSQKH